MKAEDIGGTVSRSVCLDLSIGQTFVCSNAMLDIVHVANVMSLLVGIGIGRDGLQHQPSVAVSGRLGLEPCILEKVASQTMQWVNELAGILDSG